MNADLKAFLYEWKTERAAKVLCFKQERDFGMLKLDVENPHRFGVGMHLMVMDVDYVNKKVQISICPQEYRR